MNAILYPLVLAALGAGASGEEAVKPPTGPQPQVTIARMSDDGKLVIRHIVQVPVAQAVERTIVQDGVTRKVTEVRTIFQTVVQLRTVPGKDVQGYDTNGKKVDADTVRRRLKKDTPVLISADGQPVDPFYLKLTRPGTLVLVNPASANGGGLGPYGAGGYGDPQPLPDRVLPKPEKLKPIERPKPLEKK